MVSAGLPSFQASWHGGPKHIYLTYGGALEVIEARSETCGYMDTRGNYAGMLSYIMLNPSFTNSIYGNSSTVTPSSLRTAFYIRY